ncbi:hypothetical protein SUGI_0894990 [Cryptomeria japonica]|nr:hypothetical protein SUGI_0894990 [Cryptomeria japonica]
MRNITSPCSASSPSTWHTPVPYLFAGFVSFVALIFLICFHWRNPNTTSEENGNNRSDSSFVGENLRGCSGDVKEDKVIVIMAGENMPSCIAIPTSVLGKKIAGAHHTDRRELL